LEGLRLLSERRFYLFSILKNLNSRPTMVTEATIGQFPPEGRLTRTA
jgi:hypothetical protein